MAVEVPLTDAEKPKTSAAAAVPGDSAPAPGHSAPAPGDSAPMPGESTPTPAGPVSGHPRRSASRLGWSLLAATLLLTATGALLFTHTSRPAPPVLGELPVWSLTSHTKAAVSSDSLRGSVWVTSFFFTSCTTICPKILGAMRRVQSRVVAAELPVILTSITVDPENDTVPTLALFAPSYGVIDGRWHLLSGERQAIQQLVVDGFKTYMGERVQMSDDMVDISHGARLVLVDRRGQVRGHYETDAAGLDNLFADAKLLVDEAE